MIYSCNYTKLVILVDKFAMQCSCKLKMHFFLVYLVMLSKFFYLYNIIYIINQQIIYIFIIYILYYLYCNKNFYNNVCKYSRK